MLASIHDFDVDTGELAAFDVADAGDVRDQPVLRREPGRRRREGEERRRARERHGDERRRAAVEDLAALEPDQEEQRGGHDEVQTVEQRQRVVVPLEMPLPEPVLQPDRRHLTEADPAVEREHRLVERMRVEEWATPRASSYTSTSATNGRKSRTYARPTRSARAGTSRIRK